jgi:hypothetical protein
MPSDPRLGLLLDALDEAFDRRSWHGANLRGSLRGVAVQQALWRPGTGRHNVWELALHAAYWKYVARRRISGLKRGSFLLKGSNFFPRNSGKEQDWQLEILLLENEHRELRAAVEALDPAKLELEIGPKLTYAALIRGAAAHDLYHAGQIQLLKRLYSPRTRSS